MSHSWQEKYHELKDYIAKNPKIKIGMNAIILPGDVRTEFYRLFDVFRVAFLKEKCMTLLDEALPLSTNYNHVAEEVKRSLSLSEIKVTTNLQWFLKDPTNGLIRSFFETTFDLLKNKINLEFFESEAERLTRNSFASLFELGYEKWVALSLINLLSPDSASAIPVENVKSICHEPEADQNTGMCEENLPDLEEIENLHMERSIGEDAFILSNIIAHSSTLNRYVSMGTDLADATWSANQVSKEREWQTLREIGKMNLVPRKLWPDLVLYIDDHPENIALVADFSRFCRPDIIVECMERNDWYQKDGLNEVKQNYDFLKPKLGSYVVSRVQVDEEVINKLTGKSADTETAPKQKPLQQEENLEEQYRNIHIISAGYDQSQLTPIIDVLSVNK